MQIWKCIIVYVFLLCIICHGQVQIKFQNAQRLYKEKKYHQAEGVLKSICKNQPRFIDAHRLLGIVYYRLHRLDKARKFLSHSLSHGRMTKDVLECIAQIDLKKNRIPSLISALRLQILISPEEDFWKLIYANTLTSARIYDEAESIYKKIIQEKPFHFKAFTNFGNLYIQQGKYRKAIQCLEMAYHLGDKNPSIPQAIADIYFNLNDHHPSLKWYKRALYTKNTKKIAIALCKGFVCHKKF